jgi:hypothetical protein
MINFDNIIPKSEYSSINISPFYPQHCFRAIIIGPSNSGKTNDLLNIVHNSVFHKIFLYSKTTDEDKYQFLINLQKAKEEELKSKGMNESLIHFSTSISDVIPLEELDKAYQSLYIFDDICLENAKNQEKYIGDLFIRSRKYNCSVIYLSQSYFKIPKIIRDNAQYIILKKLTDGRELQVIHRIHAGEISRKEFMEKYEQSVSTYCNHGSFVIDNVIPHKLLKLRANYVGIFCGNI